MIIDPTRLRSALREHVLELDPDVFATLVFNGDRRLSDAQRQVHEFFTRLETAAYGKRKGGRPYDQRLRALAFFEHPTSNLHSHAGLRARTQCLREAALNDGPRIWRALTGSGSAKIEITKSKGRTATYIAKAQRHPELFDHFVAY